MWGYFRRRIYHANIQLEELWWSVSSKLLGTTLTWPQFSEPLFILTIPSPYFGLKMFLLPKSKETYRSSAIQNFLRSTFLSFICQVASCAPCRLDSVTPSCHLVAHTYLVIWDAVYTTALATLGRLNVIEVDPQYPLYVHWSVSGLRRKFSGFPELRRRPVSGDNLISIPLRQYWVMTYEVQVFHCKNITSWSSRIPMQVSWVMKFKDSYTTILGSGFQTFYGRILSNKDQGLPCRIYKA